MEKTGSNRLRTSLRRKHLHGRGEDSRMILKIRILQETPPRTWRKRDHAFRQPATVGNTSTDVEKTASESGKPASNRKHLHGRGEDAVGRHSFCGAAETPPRTWRRPRYIEILRSHFGKHLHGRGEDTPLDVWHLAEKETPPRTWRRRKP